MGTDSAIEWTDHMFNPWEGCQKVGPGCDNCYAEARDQRFTGGKHWGPGAPRRLTSDANWRKPLAWNRDAAKTGTRPRVFCASLADVFDNAVDWGWRDRLWALIHATPHLDWLLLTKRPSNIANMLPLMDDLEYPAWGTGWPNVWLGCTVVNQTEADRDIPKLLAVPAFVRFLSMEPLLGPVDLGLYLSAGRPTYSIQDIGIQLDPQFAWRHGSLNWIITGGESGPKARPMHPDWARSLRDQCQAAGVPFFFKQWGEWADYTDAPHRSTAEDYIFTATGKVLGAGHPKHGGLIELGWEKNGGAWMSKVGKARAGRLLDGREWNELPGVTNA